MNVVVGIVEAFTMKLSIPISTREFGKADASDKIVVNSTKRSDVVYNVCAA